MYLLQFTVGDDCTYSSDIFVGVFTTREKAVTARDKFLKSNSDFDNLLKDDFFTREIFVDEICVG